MGAFWSQTVFRAIVSMMENGGARASAATGSADRRDPGETSAPISRSKRRQAPGRTPRGRWIGRYERWLVGVVLFAAACALGCDPDSARPTLEADDSSLKGVVQTGYRPSPPPDLCGVEIERMLALAGEPGTPQLDESRAEILARARSVPVVFHRMPEVSDDASEKVRRLRKLLRDEEDPAHAILEVLRKTRGNYAERREIFLTEDYLFAHQTVLGLRLSQVLRLDHLFSQADDRLIIERGNELIEVTRSEGRYFLPPLDDPTIKSRRKHAPRLASLLLFDRVRTEHEAFGPRIHLDFRPLQRALGFTRAEVAHRTKDGMVVRLHTYGVPSMAIFKDDGGVARLECESVQPSRLRDLGQARANYHLDQALIDPILDAAHAMIDRSLPFDEPKTEEGQQDGFLRIHFRKAYKHYESTYEFNGDSYYVFDGYGRPRLPQVCIDFITDAFDWGTGGKWPVRGEKRLYQKGALHFGSMGMENSRSVENLAEFATETPEWFDMLWLSKSEQIKFRHRTKFFEALLRDQDRYRRGDVVFIYGLKDDGKFHYHSFLIDEKDPVTGMPTVVLANAGPPQARSWEGEMQNAPLRSIVARLRVRREVLQRAHVQAKEHPGVPLEPPPKKGKDVEVPDEADQPPPPPPESKVEPPSAPSTVDAKVQTPAVETMGVLDPSPSREVQESTPKQKEPSAASAPTSTSSDSAAELR